MGTFGFSLHPFLVKDMTLTGKEFKMRVQAHHYKRLPSIAFIFRHIFQSYQLLPDIFLE